MKAKFLNGDISPEFEEYATAIGFASICWTSLEVLEKDFLTSLICRSNPEHGNLVGITVLTMDFRDVMKAILNVGFKIKKNDTWYDILKDHINYINNTLRQNRNDYVHGIWMPNDVSRLPELRKVDAKVKNTQSRLESLFMLAEKNINTKDIFELSDAIRSETIIPKFLLENFDKSDDLLSLELQEVLPPRTHVRHQDKMPNR